MKRFLYFILAFLCFASLTTAEGSLFATKDTVRQTPQDTVPIRRLTLQSLPAPLEPSAAMDERTYGVVTLSVASIGHSRPYLGTARRMVAHSNTRQLYGIYEIRQRD